MHEELSRGDIGGPGSLHRLIRGLARQRAQKRDEFITAELTNHLFQSECKLLKIYICVAEEIKFYSYSSISIWS